MACNIGAIVNSGSALQAKLASLSKQQLLQAMYAMNCQINKNGNASFNCAAIDPCIACLPQQQQLMMLMGLYCAP